MMKHVTGKIKILFLNPFFNYSKLFQLYKEVCMHTLLCFFLFTNLSVLTAVNEPTYSLVAPKWAVSLVDTGEAAKDREKLFVVEWFEKIGNNVSSEYVIHPFHKHIASIQHAGLKYFVVSLQIFSSEAVDFIACSVSLIYLHFDEHSEKILNVFKTKNPFFGKFRRFEEICV